MIEKEMEDLLWQYPEKFLNEPLKQFQRQPSSAVGRADLIFEDRIGRLLVVELKRDTLGRGAIMQLTDYYGMLKSRFPEKAVELMIVAAQVPPERRQACEQYNIIAVEIPQKKYRDVAAEVGYVFESEGKSSTSRGTTANEDSPRTDRSFNGNPHRTSSLHSASTPSEPIVEKPAMDWRPIDFADIPSREEFVQLTLNLLRRGITNSDEMRNEIRQKQKLILKKTTGKWNTTPSDKFVNEHAWALENLMERKIIEKTATKEYRLARNADSL